ncbi:MAG TPA: PilN domain-containing protein [Burkholderiaceae bacterium]|nr:PilN domain-containing protein [Burkholderiaceae bacterium]
MLRNNINLLERAKPTGLALPALRLALTLFVGTAALGGLAFLVQGHALRTVRQDLARVHAQTEHLQHAIVEVPSPDVVLADRLATEEREVQALEAVARTLSTGGLSHTSGFVGPLQAFGRATTEGVWLTGLSLDNRHGSMVVEGHALDASRIPALLQTLRAEPYFAGTAFAAIEMTPGVPNGPAPADRALKFRISTPTADVATRAAGSAAALVNQGPTS